MKYIQRRERKDMKKITKEEIRKFKEKGEIISALYDSIFIVMINKFTFFLF